MELPGLKPSGAIPCVDAAAAAKQSLHAEDEAVSSRTPRRFAISAEALEAMPLVAPPYQFGTGTMIALRTRQMRGSG